MPNKLLYILIGSLLLNAVLGSYIVRQKFSGSRSVNLAAASTSASGVKTSAGSDKLFEQINPSAGYQINAKFGNLGPKLISLGVIDLQKFKSTYANSGQALPADLEQILTRGSDSKITITSANSYFLLNFFWAVGLANKSAVLDSGEITKYGGKSELGNFASTGGWTLGKTEAMNYYSKAKLIPLTSGQADLVAKIAGNIYRPCCNNSTAFPDCNHGMALLGVLELLAASGASEDEMYQAAKYFNAFWFPGNYYDLALYFKNNQSRDFANIDPKLILSREYSSAGGWQAAKKWLQDQGLQQPPPRQGGGCGV